jgi:hypothetical protein
LEQLRPLGVLLLGDSVDFRILKFFCQFAMEQEPTNFTLSGGDQLKLQGGYLVWRGVPAASPPLALPSPALQSPRRVLVVQFLQRTSLSE